jgi:hypothetical protein
MINAFSLLEARKACLNSIRNYGIQTSLKADLINFAIYKA